MHIVSCTYDRHAAQILEVFNDAILTSTALFEYEPRAPESMVTWFNAKQGGQFPVVGIEGSGGQLLGFASYGPFRPWPAYRYSVEHSVYVHKDHRGKGLGRMLMEELIAAAEGQHYHVLVGGIEATNTGSIALHEALGFTHAGTIRHAGYKFGRWLDLSFYQLMLQTPANPGESCRGVAAVVASKSLSPWRTRPGQDRGDPAASSLGSAAGRRPTQKGRPPTVVGPSCYPTYADAA